ncbi:MAG: PepSY-associated TM helix domain-containing protein [Betaproteobacteria bacterium]
MTSAKRPRLRSLWVQIHLWLGQTLGVIGVLIGLSGSILVYDHEIDAQLNPQRYVISGPDVTLPFAAYAQRAEESLGGGARATGIRLPDQEEGPVMVFARAKADAGPFQRVYLDPPTGRVLDTASGRDWLGWLHSFHESLTLREFKGREIVGAVGIAMLISSLSGIYLWWPAGGLQWPAFKFRRGLALHRNLHYTIGIWGALVLALLSFTGIFLAYQDAGRAVVAVFGKVSPSPRGVQSATTSGTSMSVDDVAAIARLRYPDATIIGLGMPAAPRGAFRVNLREPADTASRSGTIVFIDPRSGGVLQSADRATRGDGDTFLLWQRMLHEGSVLGFAWRFAVFLGGLLPALLMTTGLIIWLRKPSVRTRRAILPQTSAP